MAIPSSEKAGSGKEFIPVSPGSHVARCVTVCDLSLQLTPFGEKKQVYLGFEVYDHKVEWQDKDGKDHSGPGLIGVTWTNNLYIEANLGKNLVSWRGKEFTPAEKQQFDLSALLGVPCMISVAHNTAKNGKVYANIASIIGCPPGVTVPAQETPSVGYSPADPALAQNLTKLPEWLQRKVGDAIDEATTVDEYESMPPADLDDDFDDLPF